MTQETTVHYFAPKEDAKPHDLGGGYVTSGVLKTRFSVIRTDKNADGFFVSLPQRKNDSTGEWVPIVDFPNAEAKEELTAIIRDKMSANTGGSNGKTKTGPRASSAPKSVTKQEPMGIPGSGTPW